MSETVSRWITGVSLGVVAVCFGVLLGGIHEEQQKCEDAQSYTYSIHEGPLVTDLHAAMKYTGVLG
ncbi:membrane protein [Gordonia Phage JonJames]|nr:membrane protein [Gordonia Phage JonJames]